MNTLTFPPIFRPKRGLAQYRILAFALLLLFAPQNVSAQSKITPETKQYTSKNPSSLKEKKQQAKSKEWSQYNQPIPPEESFAYMLFHMIFFNMWFWVILIVFGLPFITVRLNHWKKRRLFFKARHADLINPLDASARFRLASLYVDQKRYRKAKPYLLDALEIQEKTDHLDPRLLGTLGNVFRKMRDHQQAIVYYKRSLELDPEGGQGDVFCGLGASHQQLEKDDEAEEWMRKAVKANASMAEPAFRMALILFRQKKASEGRTLIKEFLQDSHRLPKFIRKKNRWWIFLMWIYPLSAWLVS